MLDVQLRPVENPMPTLKQPSVLVIGGAEDKIHGRQILTTFFKRAGGTDAVIGVIPCASREPSVIGDRYRTIFNAMGAKQVEVLDIRSRNEVGEARWFEILDQCTGARKPSPYNLLPRQWWMFLSSNNSGIKRSIW